MVNSIDPQTIFILHYALPALMISLFIYGMFPRVCLAIGLVDSTEPLLMLEEPI
jgi:hypothetical protein